MAPIFGHALDGNLHFVFAQDFSSAPELARYAAFMEDLCGLITAKYDGSLKAEHGTGRNVAPFVELEWGAAAYALMREIKDALDPDGILNPGVILNDDPQIHLKNIKPLHPAHELIDRCTECGFCEPTCPSRDLTLTPRQRITAHREIVRLEAERENPVQGAGGQGNPDRETLERLASLRKAYAYAGNATCAADGLCSLRCPAKINTGSFIKDLRRQEAGKAAEVVSGFVADHFSGTCKVMSKLLDGVDALHGFVGSELMADGSRLLRLLSFKRAPAWNRAMPKGGGALPNPSSSLPGRQAVAQSQAASAQSDTAQSQAASAQNDAAQLDAGQSAVSSSAPAVATQAVEQPKPLRVVYFPACISRLMGPGKEHSDVRSEPQVFVSLLLKAGCEVIIPKGLEKLCCGMAFASKGLTGAAARKAAELGRALREASHDGEYPVVSETSPCLLHMRETQDASLRLYEPIQFILEHLADKLSFTRLPKTVAVHATCSVRKMDLAGKLALLAGMCAAHVVVPEGVDCCGFAGDRGFTHPELNESALKPLRLQVSGCEAGYSVGRTCQIGLSLHGGIPYYSILHLVDEATAPI